MKSSGVKTQEDEVWTFERFHLTVTILLITIVIVATIVNPVATSTNVNAIAIFAHELILGTGGYRQGEHN